MADETPPGDIREDTYAAQREELLVLLKTCLDKNEPLEVHGRTLLRHDDITSVLQKIKNRHHFSRRERAAITEAGFALEKIYPGL